MNKELRALISEHARRVRIWAEGTNRRRRYPQPDNLNGWCAIASAKLWRQLKAAGIDAEIHMATEDIGCHVFLVIEDHVVDITATQFHEFRDKKLVIMHHREAEQYWYYQTADVFETAEELRANQIRTGWPIDQTAHRR